MKKLTKPEVKKAVVGALVPVMLNFELKKPSKRIQKSISKISKQILGDWKVQAKKAAKALKKSGKKSKPGKKEAS